MGHLSWGKISPGTLTILQLLTRITWPAVWTQGWVEVEARLRLEVGNRGRGGVVLWVSLPKSFSLSLFPQDLVAWVTASFLHIPHAEDVPNTLTLGNRVGFLLRPYNFFDEDPSIFSPGSVYFEKGQDTGLCSVNPVACIPHLATCVPDMPPFFYQDL